MTNFQKLIDDLRAQEKLNIDKVNVDFQHRTTELLEQLNQCDQDANRELTEMFREKVEGIMARRKIEIDSHSLKEREKTLQEIERFKIAIDKEWRDITETMSTKSGAVADNFKKNHQALKASCVEAYVDNLNIVESAKTETAIQIATDQTNFDALLKRTLELVITIFEENLQQGNNMMTLFDRLVVDKITDLSNEFIDQSSVGDCKLQIVRHNEALNSIIESHRLNKETAFFKIYDSCVEENRMMIERLREADLENFGLSEGGIAALFE